MKKLASFFRALQVSIVLGFCVFNALDPSNRNLERAGKVAILAGLTLLLLSEWIHETFRPGDSSTDDREGE